ncbi:MAG: pseudouridine synthase [Acidobacteria bacterium]|nr:pseudouridine synthase [Acidobacteriota bacterium]
MERIQKIIARCTRYSRRAAEDLIREGRVAVNGKPAGIGDQADPETDRITLDGKPLVAAPKPEYILLNKPRGYLCSVSDPEGRHTVLELIQPRSKVYPVGRLDMYSMGLVLLTNDGDLTVHMTKAGRHCPKVYLVKVAGMPGEHLLDQLRKGIQAEGVRYAPCEVEARRSKPGSYSWFKVTLFQGKNRQLRKMFEAIHHPVFQIKRIAIGPLTDSGLEVGQWRRLTDEEIGQLKRMPVKLGKGSPVTRASRVTGPEAPDEGKKGRHRPPGRPSPPNEKGRETEHRSERPPRREGREGRTTGRPRPQREGERRKGGPRRPDRSAPPRKETLGNKRFRPPRGGAGHDKRFRQPRGESPGGKRFRPPPEEAPDDNRVRQPRGESPGKKRFRPTPEQAPDDNRVRQPRGESPGKKRFRPPREENPGGNRVRPPRKGAERPEGGNRPDRPRRRPPEKPAAPGSAPLAGDARKTRLTGHRSERTSRTSHDRKAEPRATPENPSRPRRPAGKPFKGKRPGRPPRH